MPNPQFDPGTRMKEGIRLIDNERNSRNRTIEWEEHHERKKMKNQRRKKQVKSLDKINRLEGI